jgi:hypothetical protein
MKTTIDIADSLLTRAKAIAHRDNTTLRSLVEQGLDIVMQQRARPPKSKFKTITFRGRPNDPVPDLNWEKIRDLVYDERPPSS